MLDFAVIGFQKCGTDSLRHWLQKLPGCEVPYWEWGAGVVEDAASRPGMSRGYVVPRAKEQGMTLGTVNPQLTLGPVREIAARMRVCHPDARLVAISRDPIERAYSAWRMFRDVGHEKRSFDEAIRSCLGAPEEPREWTEQYVRAGEYGRILDIYREEGFTVFCVSLEFMHTLSTRGQLAQYLGLSIQAALDTEFPHEHSAVNPAEDMSPQARAMLVEHFTGVAA